MAVSSDWLGDWDIYAGIGLGLGVGFVLGAILATVLVVLWMRDVRSRSAASLAMLLPDCRS